MKCSPWLGVAGRACCSKGAAQAATGLSAEHHTCTWACCRLLIWPTWDISVLVHLVLQAQGLATKSQEPPILANHGEAGQPACGRVELGSFMLDTEVIVCCGCSCHWVEAAFAAVQVLASCEHSPALKPSTVVATPLPLAAAAATYCCCCHPLLLPSAARLVWGRLPTGAWCPASHRVPGQDAAVHRRPPVLPHDHWLPHASPGVGVQAWQHEHERLALVPALEAGPSISLKASSFRWAT